MADKLLRTIGNQENKLPECLKGRYQEDPMFKAIIDDPGNFTNFTIDEGLIFYRSEGSIKLAIPDVSVNGQSVRRQ